MHAKDKSSNHSNTIIKKWGVSIIWDGKFSEVLINVGPNKQGRGMGKSISKMKHTLMLCIPKPKIIGVFSRKIYLWHTKTI